MKWLQRVCIFKMTLQSKTAVVRRRSESLFLFFFFFCPPENGLDLI